MATCSEEQNTDLFHAVLGGLGQFGIITQARIALEPAPKMVINNMCTKLKLLQKNYLTTYIFLQVKWIRALYADFSTFTNDQEYLISSTSSLDYVEGFVIINRTGLLNNWRSSFNPKDPVQANEFTSEGKILFCLEVAKYYNPESGHIDQVRILNPLIVYPQNYQKVLTSSSLMQEIDTFISELNYTESTLFMSEVTYVDFLDRVHVSEMKLREKGLWEVPHPWLNLLIPRSKIHEFANEVFGNILKDTSNGPVLIYPVNKSRYY